MNALNKAHGSGRALFSKHLRGWHVFFGLPLLQNAYSMLKLLKTSNYSTESLCTFAKFVLTVIHT